jgi:hypothetical protein
MLKKIVLIVSLLLTQQVFASKYIMTLNNSSYKNAIKISCTKPLVLNNDGTSCINDTPVCDAVSILNEAQDACISSLDSLEWIERSDSCNGVRPLNNNNNFLVLRSNSSTRNTNPVIPKGYRWITVAEYTGMVITETILNYHGKCGLSAYPLIGGFPQKEITFIDTVSTDLRTHAGTNEGVVQSDWDYPSSWLGIIVIKITP